MKLPVFSYIYPMIYGYIRVSTAQQNVENQRFEIANFAQKSGFSIDKWITEAVSSQKELKKRKLGAFAKQSVSHWARLGI